VGGLTIHTPEELRRLYDRRFADRDAYRDAVWRVLVDARFARYVPEGATVLDLGCGQGELIRNLVAPRRIGMDMNPAAERLTETGVEVVLHDCAQPWPLEDQTLDVIFSSNFFEHLPTKADLRRTLVEAARCLRPGGRLVALGPNVRRVPGRYWDFYDHHIPLTERSLAELLVDCGFEITESIGSFLPYTMSEGRPPPVWTLRLYLRLPIAWRVLGKQFLVVAKRPALA